MNTEFNSKKDGTIAALDVGSSQVACLIADIDGRGGIIVRGFAHHACKGVQNGVVVDMDEAEKAIRACVDVAENMAKTTVSNVVLSFTGGEPTSHIIEATIDISEQMVSEGDIHSVIETALQDLDPGEDTVLHAFPATFGVDGSLGVKNPVGMYGGKLSVAMHAITVQSGPLKNLEAVVRRAHLNVADIVLTPYASGLATLVDDEAKMGAACIDMGAGTTSISIFAQGAMVHTEVLPIGGAHITEEIARAILTPLEQAERLKTFSGAAICSNADDRYEIEVPQVGEDGSDNLARLPKSNLTSVMQKELEILFATLSERLDASGFSGVAGKRVVITGGVSQAEGIRGLASDMLNRMVRVGTPQPVEGLPQAAQYPPFAGALGLLIYTVKKSNLDYGYGGVEHRKPSKSNGIFGKLGKWVKENF